MEDISEESSSNNVTTDATDGENSSVMNSTLGDAFMEDISSNNNTQNNSQYFDSANTSGSDLSFYASFYSTASDKVTNQSIEQHSNEMEKEGLTSNQPKNLENNLGLNKDNVVRANILSQSKKNNEVVSPWIKPISTVGLEKAKSCYSKPVHKSFQGRKDPLSEHLIDLTNIVTETFKNKSEKKEKSMMSEVPLQDQLFGNFIAAELTQIKDVNEKQEVKKAIMDVIFTKRRV